MNVKIVAVLFFQVSYPTRFCHLRLDLLEHVFVSPVRLFHYVNTVSRLWQWRMQCLRSSSFLLLSTTSLLFLNELKAHYASEILAFLFLKNMFNISKQLKIYRFLRHDVPLRADTNHCKKTDLSPVHRCQKIKQPLHPFDDYAFNHI
jgi:hypothetical protein